MTSGKRIIFIIQCDILRILQKNVHEPHKTHQRAVGRESLIHIMTTYDSPLIKYLTITAILLLKVLQFDTDTYVSNGVTHENSDLLPVSLSVSQLQLIHVESYN